jgi:hypothetical protein
MILIDKSHPIQNIILTLSESTTIQDVPYVMMIKCDATRQIYKIALPENVSSSPERYDLFRIDSTVFTEMESGYYSYSVYQQNSDTTLDNEPIEDGKLLIKSAKIDIPEVGKYLVYDLS